MPLSNPQHVDSVFTLDTWHGKCGGYSNIVASCAKCTWTSFKSLSTSHLPFSIIAINNQANQGRFLPRVNPELRTFLSYSVQLLSALSHLPKMPRHYPMFMHFALNHCLWMIESHSGGQDQPVIPSLLITTDPVKKKKTTGTSLWIRCAGIHYPIICRRGQSVFIPWHRWLPSAQLSPQNHRVGLNV